MIISNKDNDRASHHLSVDYFRVLANVPLLFTNTIAGFIRSCITFIFDRALNETIGGEKKEYVLKKYINIIKYTEASRVLFVTMKIFFSCTVK